jgi:hypothetical protein
MSRIKSHSKRINNHNVKISQEILISLKNLNWSWQTWLKSWPDLVWIGEVKILKNFQWEIFLKSVSTLLKSCSGCVKTPWSRSWLLSTVKAPRLNNNNNPNINFFLNCYKALQKECCCGAMIFQWKVI